MLQCIEDCKYRHMNLGGSKSEFDDFARVSLHWCYIFLFVCDYTILM